MPIHETELLDTTRSLAELRPRLALLSSESLERVRVDIPTAVTVATGALGPVMHYRERARTELGEDIAVYFDQLRAATGACSAAHAEHMTFLHGTKLDDAVGALSGKRRLLQLEAESLVNKKRMPASRLGALVGGTGYRPLAFDVLQLVAAFRNEWAAVEGYTRVTQLELDEAAKSADALLVMIGENDHADSGSSPSGELRLRAYTHFVETYSQVRRAITFLRWKQDDVDKIAPSLFAGRPRRSASDEDPSPVGR